MNTDSPGERKHAVVIGASMSGLLAAKVLSERYQAVTVVERDSLGSANETRRGVPQARHTHGLLAGGREALEKLFPGFSEELRAAGAIPSDILGESRWFLEGGYHARVSSGVVGLLVSRPLLERTLRERVRALPNVRFRDGQGAEPIASEDRRRILGVALSQEKLPADLVVDAGGRGSQSPLRLQEWGYAKPAEERVEVGVRYTTRIFRRGAEDLGGDLAVIIPPTPSGKRGGVMIAQEFARWTVTLVSHFSAGAPTDLGGFIEFSRTLPAPDIYESIRGAEPIGEPAVYNFPASIRRRYEALARFPLGYLVMGDALSSFNPIYGQGMSVAALEALELRAVLEQGEQHLARRFFARAAKVIDTPWSIAVGNDLRMPETTGARTLPVRFINRYIESLHRAAHHDPHVSIAFHRVSNLLAPPSTILDPRVAWRVLRRNRPRRGQSLGDAHASPATLRAAE